MQRIFLHVYVQLPIAGMGTKTEWLGAAVNYLNV